MTATPAPSTPPVPADKPVFSAATIDQFAQRALVAAGVAADEADEVADSLVQANLRGLDSHGVIRLPQYCERVEAGLWKSGVPLEIVDQGPARIVAEAGFGLGQVQMRRLVERMRPIVAADGLCLATMRHGGHIGRLGEWAEVFAADGHVSLWMANLNGGIGRVAPPGGLAPLLATNPICFAVPSVDPQAGPGEAVTALLFDGSTSATAEGRVRLAHQAGRTVPDGWLLDSAGCPTNDPATLYGSPPGTLRPMCAEAPHKGFAFALMVEILAGALAGGLVASKQPSSSLGNNVFGLVIDPGRFGGRDHFAAQVLRLLEAVRDNPKADGVETILLPGEPEQRTCDRRRAEGLPIDQGVVDQLNRLADRLGVPRLESPSASS